MRSTAVTSPNVAAAISLSSPKLLKGKGGPAARHLAEAECSGGQGREKDVGGEVPGSDEGERTVMAEAVGEWPRKEVSAISLSQVPDMPNPMS